MTALPYAKVNCTRNLGASQHLNSSFPQPSPFFGGMHLSTKLALHSIAQLTQERRGKKKKLVAAAQREHLHPLVMSDRLLRSKKL